MTTDAHDAGGVTEAMVEAVYIDSRSFRPELDRLQIVGLLEAAEAARIRPADDPGEVERLRAKFDRLLIAFHDATRCPLGVTPESGSEFYDFRMAERAEGRRRALADRTGDGEARDGG